MAFDNDELNKRRDDREKLRRSYDTQVKWMKRVLILTMSVTLLCCGALLVVRQGWLDLLLQAPTPQPEQTQPTETVPVESPDTVIHLVAGGDVNITDQVVAAGALTGGFDYTDMFLDVQAILSAADLTTLNFEGNVFGDEYGTQSRSAPAQLLDALRRAGVDLLQTANSQSVTNGILGLSATLQAIRQAKLQPVGTFANTEEFEKTGGYVIREVAGVRIAFVAFTKGMDGRGLPLGSENCVNLLYTDYNTTYQKVDEDGITRILRAVADEEPDLTVALLHWGSEFNDQFSTTQKKICKLMDQLGVDAIIGTHSHYVQGIGKYPDTDMLVASSLGDFLGDGDKAGTNYSILLDLEITKDGDSGETKITGFSYTPIFLDTTGGNVRVLRIREAMTAYESNYINKVTPEVYEAMRSALLRIEDRVTKPIVQEQKK